MHADWVTYGSAKRPLASVRITVARARLEASYTHNVLQVPHPTPMPHPSSQPHTVGVGWGGAGGERGVGWPGVGHWEAWVLEEPRVHMQQKYICEHIYTHVDTRPTMRND